ncbi:RNA polymerase sigma-70 factor (ECF subfamily) [Hymenobacter luteus]|uniref:RNA polymerase sigma-70 factor (ECF subfamily) n=2 Tax=Hymenobacter TaxID=89966 RepID=A0A7W9T072_9BACT|nr:MULTISPECIES: sigma-70 family RNA polymerase sigma factor [Hymenobacter]MBB4600632.1 RNA polymerase sigma-70 factor (ECF subfamily) [Hymenobacter latericoloratus]MBB6059161.1 RNA polymerase sigma-70 factor (ECF subfamily) [Hymenobacter luteus]
MPAALTPDFLHLLQRYQPLLRRVVRMYCTDADDQQDLYQDIVLQLWRAWPTYQARASAKLSTWLYRVALNVAISDLRLRTRKPPPERFGAALPEVAMAPEAGPDADDLGQLYQAIERLSDVEKAFVLLYLEERTYEEMADILGITQNNVRVKMHRVQDKLRHLLTQPA